MRPANTFSNIQLSNSRVFFSDRRGKKAAPYRSIFQRGSGNAGGMDE